ncbi:MAG TPA: hypothetical protein VFW40_11585 [Capsulimonadaceae bacterium]|nr:hypothetical protein [Capsulimonadaceae bacterium]
MDITLDDWVRTEILPLGYSEPLMTCKLLERFLNNETVSDVHTFAWAIMNSCSRTAIEFAEKLVLDAESPLSSRFQAMSIIIEHTSGRLSDEVGMGILKELLEIGPKIRNDRYYYIMLLDQAISKDECWQACKSDIRKALILLYSELNKMTPVSLLRQASCKIALRNVQHAW